VTFECGLATKLHGNHRNYSSFQNDNTANDSAEMQAIKKVTEY